MDLKEQATHFCSHIETLTQVHCTILDLRNASFCLPPCPCHCEGCDVVRVHQYGSGEAQRWDGKFIYFCPRNLVFSAVTLRRKEGRAEYSLITGPFRMLTGRDEFEDEDSDPTPDYEVPRLTTQQARSLNEIVNATCGYLTGAPVTPDVDSGRQAEVLQRVYDLSRLSTASRYPIEEERELQDAIRDGSRDRAQEVLTRLLSRLYLISGGDQATLKIHVRELLSIMARGAMEGGADANDIFKFCYSCENDMESAVDFESLGVWLTASLHGFIRFLFDTTVAKHQNVIRKTTALIQENLAEKLTLEQAADAVYLSKSYFCRILKEELGCTFTEYVNRIRVETSKKYLEHTLISVSDVAATVGFEDPSYFTRVFRKITGVTPKKYRELHAKDSE